MERMSAPNGPMLLGLDFCIRRCVRMESAPRLMSLWSPLLLSWEDAPVSGACGHDESSSAKSGFEDAYMYAAPWLTWLWVFVYLSVCDAISVFVCASFCRSCSPPYLNCSCCKRPNVSASVRNGKMLHFRDCTLQTLNNVCPEIS